MRLLMTPIRSAIAVLKECLAAYERVLLRGGLGALATTLAGVTVCWILYTPIHELLHALGCWLTGGEVRELQLQPWYGGTLLAKIFPFVTAGGPYAGRLAEFTVPNDAAYLLVDLLPYSLSLFGLTIARLAAKRDSAFGFGVALVPALVPLWAIPGDFFEATSLLTSYLAEAIVPAMPRRGLVADDVIRLIGELGEAGLGSPFTYGLVIVTLLMAAYAAIGCLALQRPIANRLCGAPAKKTNRI